MVGALPAVLPSVAGRLRAVSGAAFAVLPAVLAGAALAILPAAPALAHAADAPAASDFRTRLVSVSPQPDGVTVRVVENGSRIELRNRSDRDLVVLGYSGEPYLRIGPAGVFTNTRSPATYLNTTLDGASKPPAGTDAKAAPNWRKVNGSSSARWHDHRTHWMGNGLPPAAAADPGSQHRIADWTVDLIAGDTPVTVAGTLDYYPPPSAPTWWAAMLLVAAAVAVLARRAWQWAVPALGGLLAVAAIAELTDGVGRALDSGATGIGVLGTLLTIETYGTLTALGALAAAVLAFRRRPAAPFAMALAAACLGVLGGLTDLAVFTHSLAPVPWAGTLARLCTAATIALSAGVAVAGALRSRTEPAAASPQVTTPA